MNQNHPYFLGLFTYVTTQVHTLITPVYVVGHPLNPQPVFIPMFTLLYC